jgi:hypothetical protein
MIRLAADFAVTVSAIEQRGRSAFVTFPLMVSVLRSRMGNGVHLYRMPSLFATARTFFLLHGSFGMMDVPIGCLT